VTRRPQRARDYSYSHLHLKQRCTTSITVNPYEEHPSLTQIEADVLWEYAKLNQRIKDVRCTPPQLAKLWWCCCRVQCPCLIAIAIASCMCCIWLPNGSFVPRLRLVIQTRTLSETPDEAMLKRLRILERKMGLVLTLVRTVICTTNNSLVDALSSSTLQLTRWLRVVQGIRCERADAFDTPTRR